MQRSSFFGKVQAVKCSKAPKKRMQVWGGMDGNKKLTLHLGVNYEGKQVAVTLEPGYFPPRDVTIVGVVKRRICDPNTSNYTDYYDVIGMDGGTLNELLKHYEGRSIRLDIEVVTEEFRPFG